MEETKLLYELPPGFPDASTGFYEGQGHEDLDGTVGDVKVTFMYSYPQDWRRESPTSLNLIYEMSVPYLSAVKGIETHINTLAGDTIKVLFHNSFLQSFYKLKTVTTDILARCRFI